MLKTNTIIVDVIEGCILPNYVLCVIHCEEINKPFIVSSYTFNTKTKKIRVTFQYNIYKLRKQKITKLLDNEKI